MKTGIELIAIERQEQIEKHGRTVESDIQLNQNGELVKVAKILLNKGGQFPANWELDYCVKLSNKNDIDKLVIAGALISAEIDRLKAIEG